MKPLYVWAGLVLLALLGMAPVWADESEFDECEDDIHCDAIREWRRDILDMSRTTADDIPLYEDLDQLPYRSNPDDPPGDPRLADFIPDYGTTRSDNIMELLQSFAGNPEECVGLTGEQWEECYEENQATPAEIPRITSEYTEQLEEGESPSAEAYQLLQEHREHEEVQLSIGSDGDQDRIFELATFILGNPENPVSQSLVGDCDTIEVPITEQSTVRLENLLTCHRLFAPPPDQFSCDAERIFTSSRVESDAIAVQMESVVPLRWCELKRDEAIDDCQVAACGPAASQFRSACIARCQERRAEEEEDEEDEGENGENGENGDDEPTESCSEECSSPTSSFRASCEAGTSGCNQLGTQTRLNCYESCDGADTGCISACDSLGAEAADNCNNRCDDEGQEAFDDCPLGERRPFAAPSEGLSFSYATLGSGFTPPAIAVAPDADLVIEVPQLNLGSASENFTANHTVVVTGGSGSVSTWGSPGHNYRSEFTVQGNAIEEIRLLVDGYSVNQNRIDGCTDFFDAIADNFCTGEMDCDPPSPCIDVGAGTGTAICQSEPSIGISDLLAPWHSSHPNALALKDIEPKPPGIFLEELCGRFVESGTSDFLDCSYYLSDDGSGEIITSCYIDVNGVERCIDAIGEGLEPFLPGSGDIWRDNCRTIASRQGCSRESARDGCVEDGEGPVTGRCYVNDIVYDCGQVEEIESVVGMRREVECGESGERISCMGGECTYFEEEYSDPTMAIEATSLVREMEKDATCFQHDENTPVSQIGEDCEIELFRGEALECKIPIGSNLGITPDCCYDGFDFGESETDFVEYMDAKTAAYSAGTHAWEAQELAGKTTRDHREGGFIDPPDPDEFGDPPGPTGTSYGDGSPFTLQSGTTEDQPAFATQSEEVITAPRSGGMPTGREAHYLARPLTTPFEIAAAQAGYTPRNRGELAQAKTASGGETSTVRFDRAMGQGIGAHGALGSDFYNQLFEPDGTPRWQRRRGGSGVWDPADPPTREPGAPSPGDPIKPGDPIIIQGMGGPAQQAAGLQFSPKGLSETEFKAALMAQSGLSPVEIDQPMILQGGLPPVGEAVPVWEGRSWATAASIGQAVAYAYAAYAIVRAIGHWVFKCDQEEAQLGFAREARRCSYVGKYCARRVRLGFIRICIENREAHCCYNSAFSRIFVEQLRENDGIGFGGPKEPNCSGYSIDQIANVDMSQVDLSEWLAMLNLAGRVPGGAEAGPTGQSLMASLQSPLTQQGGPGAFVYGSPRRSIVGTSVGATGPDGMVSTSNRVGERLDRNLTAMRQTRERLAQRDTDHFDDELMQWYAETTVNPDPPTNPDIELPEDFGEKNPEELDLMPEYCEAIGAPQEPYPGRRYPTSFPTSPVVLDTYHDDARYSAWFSVNQSADGTENVAPGEYVALPLQWPSSDRFLHYLHVWGNTNWFGDRDGPHVNSGWEWALSGCPGDFDLDVEPGCTSSKIAGDPNPWASWRRWTPVDCGFRPGQTVYMNIRVNQLPPACAEDQSDSCTPLSIMAWTNPR